MQLDASFSLDLPGGNLSYLIVSGGVPDDEVHAIVIRRRDGAGPDAIVHRVSGPGNAAAEGSLKLTAHMLHDLLNNHLELSLHTADAPLGAVSLPLQVYR